MSTTREPVRLLSIDGGGVRGLSALVILKQIVERTNAHRQKQGLVQQKPWEMFDMMGGTSTGGLIAIMLGRLRMTIDEAIDQYRYLSGEAFTKKNILKLAAQDATLELLKSRFKTAPLEEALKRVIGEDWETKLLNDGSEGPGKVFVVSHHTGFNSVRIMRSYKNPEKAAPRSEWKIFQAARATSAAMRYFEPITIDGVQYRDGGLMENNPVALLHAEAGEVFEGREQIIVSVGTGLVLTKAFDPSIKTVAEDLANIATDTERVADEFFRRDGSKLANENRYFRFNVPEIGEKGLAESSDEDLTYLEEMTLAYVDKGQIAKELRTCSTKLAEGASVSIIQSVPVHEEVAVPEQLAQPTLEQRFAVLNPPRSQNEH